jgi:hypothetical protein
MKKRATLYSLCATAMTICGLALGAAPASASIRNTPGYFHIVNAGSGRCIDASLPDDNHATDFAQQWRCLNTAMEEWTFVPVDNPADSRTGVFEIVNNATGECLENFLTNFGGVSGPVILQPCRSGYLPQRWYFGNRGQDSSGPYFQLVNEALNRCLDLENGDPSDGVPMQAWDCNANTYNQRWRQL